jgi:uncharacterized repeat protein (TIGR03803 family)
MRTMFPSLLAALGLAIAVSAPDTCDAATLKTLVSFNGANGNQPVRSLVGDGNGNLFGTTFKGGANDLGTVFEIVKTFSGYATTPTTLVSFNGTNGANPAAELMIDANGNLFGTTGGGGANNNGTVFEIAKTANSYAATPTTLVSFNGTNGSSPQAGVTADGNGNLFGTTSAGGASNNGTVFEIVNIANGYATTPTTLVSFNGADGSFPQARLIIDANGNLFGTTTTGLISNNGGVFEVKKTAGGYASAPTILAAFTGIPDGANPTAGVITDTAGNLFGTTLNGGAGGEGSVFELIKNGISYASTPTILVSFDLDDGANPQAGLIIDSQGNLFGTTDFGGPTPPRRGNLFEIVKMANGYANTPTVVYNFCSQPNCTDGATSFAGLIADAQGRLFGTTSAGGTSNDGTVFQVTGSGFVPAFVLGGTPGTRNCYGDSVLALLQQHHNLDDAARALDLDNAGALVAAILHHCRPLVR